MKKLFALLLLPSLAFAGKIGENYIGIGTYHQTYSYDVRTNPNIGSWDAEFDGFGFSIGGNLNLSQLDDKKWGADLSLGYSQADLSPNSEAVDFLTTFGVSSTEANSDIKVKSFGLNLIPYTKLGDGILFASLGFGRAETNDDKESGLVLGAGYEISSGKFTITPTFSHISLDTPQSDQMTFGVKTNYKLSHNLNLLLGYSHTDADNLIDDGLTIDPSANTFSAGLSYNF
jgi:opacity protein-like surface antigen